MKSMANILFAALLLFGCSQKHTVSVDLTVDIVAGKDIVLPGYILNIKKRAGCSLEGIRVVQRGPDGRETIITAKTGTVTQEPKQTFETQPADAKTHERLRVVVVQNPVKMTLFNASVQIKSQSGTTKMTVQEMELDF